MQIIAYDPAWRDATLAFRRRMYPCNPQAGDEQHFVWRQERHPFGAGLSLLAVQDGQVIGHWLGIPERIRCPGAVRTCQWMVDLAVAPEHRDTMAAMQLFRAAGARGENLLAIGVPEDLLPFYTVFRWQRLAIADTFFRVFQPGPSATMAERSLPMAPLVRLADRLLPLAWRARSALRRATSVRLESQPGQEFDRLFDELAPYLGRCGDRGSAWLRWKLFDRPCGAHELLVARDPAGRLQGWIALKRRERAGKARWAEIVDFLCHPDRPALFDELVEAASSRALQAGCAFVRLRCALPEHSARLLRPSWIRQVRSPIDDLFLLPGADPGAREDLLGHPWHLSSGASDSVDTGQDEWADASPTGPLR